MKPSRDNTLMGVAELWAEHSTCSRLAVGAVISREGRTLSSGYNGAPAGLPHCDHRECTCRYEEGQLLGGDPPSAKHGQCRTAVRSDKGRGGKEGGRTGRT